MLKLRTFLLLAPIAIACGGSTVVSPDGSVNPDYTTCPSRGFCQLRAKSCCGTCGSPTKTDMVGLNIDKVSAYSSSVCSSSQGCPECALEVDVNLTAVCRTTQCLAVDVREDPMSTCTTDLDCRLRYGGDCCEYCAATGPEKLIALNTEGLTEYRENMCHPDQAGCPKCAVIYPLDRAATCNPTTKHCEVVKVVVDAGAGG